MNSVDFIKQFPVKNFTKGQLILSEGDHVDSLYAIQSGYIKVSSLNNDGVERLLWLAGRYDIAPTEKLFSCNCSVTFNYTALTDVSTYVIDKAAFIEYSQQNPAIMHEIARSMCTHYDDLLNRINTIEQSTIHAKLVHTLHYLAQRFSADHTVDLHQLGLKLTQQDIAEMIGATRETTSLELQKLRQDGLIDYDRSSFVVNVSKLSPLLVTAS